MLDQVDWSQIRTIVEYGPGIGSFTNAILKRMRGDARFIAIDTSRDFVRHLTITIDDHRFRAVHGSAADVRSILAARGIDRIDCAISGLPFSTLPAGVGDRIAQETAALLSDQGSFLTYQMSSAVRPMMERAFGMIQEGHEWFNVPPCRLYRASVPKHHDARAIPSPKVDLLGGGLI